MRKHFSLFIFTVVIALLAIPASADDPPCRLGTAFAVEPNRQVGSEEITVLTPRPIVALVAQREEPGSTRIVEKRCELPANEPLSCNSAQCWVKRCGNAARDFEGWSPFVLIKGEKGDPGKVGPQGPEGPRGFPGENFVPPPGRPLCGESWRTGRRWVCVGVGLVVVGGTIAALSGDDGNNHNVTTEPPTPGQTPATNVVRQPVMAREPARMGMTLVRF